MNNYKSLITKLSALLIPILLPAQPADTLVSPQIVRQKFIDNGGSGLFKAVAVSEKSLPDHVVYRPQNLYWASVREHPLPVLIFANGGCTDTSIHYERMLTEIASKGYVVIAIGQLKMTENERKEVQTPSSMVTDAINWICLQAQNRKSDYFGCVDTTRIAAAGHSCGGAQVLCNAADARLKTYLILNAGMGNMEMAGADRESLKQLHAPVLYLTGGKQDVAYDNAQLDYARISHVPVAYGDMPAAGHGGTYMHSGGGDFGRMITDWLDWQLKGHKEKSAVFFTNKPTGYPEWTMKSKNFKSHAGRIKQTTMPCRLLNGVSERKYSIYLPGGYDTDTTRTYPVLYLMHGGGGAHTDWAHHGRLQQLADSLTDGGRIDDMIIVCPEGNENHMMYFNAPEWRYEDYFFQEFLPYIEQNYRVRTDKGGRAIAGFSMGGGAAVVYGLHHPELFSLVYDISGYLRRQPLAFLKNDPSAEWRQQLVEENNPIRCLSNGTEEEVKTWKQTDWSIRVGDHDFTLEANMDLVKALREKNIPYRMYVNTGEHDWRFVRPALADALKQANKAFRALWITNGERRIYGILSRPAHSNGKQPVAIIAHGFNGTHHSGLSYFETLNALGYQCYTFDFPGGSVHSRSDNNTMNMSIRDEQSDLEAIVRYFKSQPDVDASRIVLIGESQGGLVSALTASHLKADIHALILVFPAFCIPDNWNERYPHTTDIPDTTRLWNVPLSRRFFTEIRNLQVFPTLKKFTNPVLLIHGDADPIVPVDYSRRAVRTYKKARLHIIPGAGHGFSPKEFAESLQQIRQFLGEEVR